MSKDKFFVLGLLQKRSFVCLGISLFITDFLFKHFDCDLVPLPGIEPAPPMLKVLTTRLMKAPLWSILMVLNHALKKKKKKPCLDSFLVYQIRLLLEYFSVLKLKFWNWNLCLNYGEAVLENAYEVSWLSDTLGWEVTDKMTQMDCVSFS